MNILFVKKSGNKKTGPIPVTYSPSTTCPPTCPHNGKGCYPRFHHAGRDWKRLDEGKAGISWEHFLEEVGDLPLNQIWRYGVAGDLPGEGNRIEPGMLNQLVFANNSRRGFCYTHKKMTEANKRKVFEANRAGFTINLSADDLADADRKKNLGIAPVVCTIPEDPSIWPTLTPEGRKIIPCPAVTHEGTDCESCQLCARKDRKVIIGFPAHGTGKRMVEKVYFSGGVKVN